MSAGPCLVRLLKVGFCGLLDIGACVSGDLKVHMVPIFARCSPFNGSPAHDLEHLYYNFEQRPKAPKSKLSQA